MNKFLKNEKVKFLPECEDGESEFIYILIENPDGGRVKVMPFNSVMEIPPVQVVKTEWLIKI
jgi:hypothetical protein